MIKITDCLELYTGFSVKLVVVVSIFVVDLNKGCVWFCGGTAGDKLVAGEVVKWLPFFEGDKRTRPVGSGTFFFSFLDDEIPRNQVRFQLSDCTPGISRSILKNSNLFPQIGNFCRQLGDFARQLGDFAHV